MQAHEDRLSIRNAEGELIVDLLPLSGHMRDEPRFALLSDIANLLVGDLAAGGSEDTVVRRFRNLRSLMQFAESANLQVSHASVRDLFVKWVAARMIDVRNKKLKQNTLYHDATTIAHLLSRIFDQRSTDLLRRARIQRTKKTPGFIASDTHKQNLERTFSMGGALADICANLTADAVHGPIPVALEFRSGQVIQHWCGRQSTEGLKNFDPAQSKPSRVREALDRRETLNNDVSVETRFPLINLRIEAELLIFIAQTSMNLSQARELQAGKFSYESFIDGYRVRRIYKGRKRGEVEFEIFSEYRPHFAKYLDWLSDVMPEWNRSEGLIFPFVPAPGKASRGALNFTAVKGVLKKLGIPFVGPRLLRKTRVNWMLRRSGDENLSAEQAQHTRETLISAYEIPNHQRAVAEAARFWQETDPSIQPPSPGSCVEQTPVPVADIPPAAPRPDCANPAGCLFCANHRDVDSFDHVWSLSSYRYLKTVEQSKYRVKGARTQELPAALVIQRASDKLEAFSLRDEAREDWVREAQCRVDEEDFHPAWDGFIKLAEVGAR